MSRHFLNYHHLRYFRAVALENSLTKAARKLGVAQSALSMQIRQLEEALGCSLFDRQRKCLTLTEEGRIALDYAGTIFRAGEELTDVLQDKTAEHRRILRVGAVATLSRNFQLHFLRPLLGRSDVELVLRSGSLGSLIRDLEDYRLDAVLSNRPIHREGGRPWHNHLLEEQSVSLVGTRLRRRNKISDLTELRDIPLLLPTLDSAVREAFDQTMEQHCIRPRIAAEVDDMAMLRLLAREGAGLALVPPIVVENELRRKQLVEWHRFGDIRESFYATCPARRFPNSLLKELLKK
jgi:LysR family transcriptional activator of nhaA